MTVLKLLGPAWTRTFRCVWMLEELGLPYEHVGASAMPMSRNVRQYNKTGKVPVLLEYDHAASAAPNGHTENDQSPSFVLTESVAIVTYLGDVHGRRNPDTANLVPVAGTRERAVYDQIMCCILSELDAQGLWIHRKHEALAQYFGAIPQAVKVAESQFARVNEDLAATRLNPYLLGDQFTAADIVYVHCLDWCKSIGWHESWPANIEPYRQLCHARPAYQRAKAVRDAERAAMREANKKDEQPNSSSTPSNL